MINHTAPQRLAAIVASRPPWFRARLSTIMVWPTIRRDWAAILHYAHYTPQPGEAAPPGINVTYPHDTDHPVTLDGEDLAAAFQAQVRELEIGGEVGSLTISRLAEPPGTPSECPPTTGWTILTDSGSDAERRVWERRVGLTLAWESATPRLVGTESLRRKE